MTGPDGPPAADPPAPAPVPGIAPWDVARAAVWIGVPTLIVAPLGQKVALLGIPVCAAGLLVWVAILSYGSLLSVRVFLHLAHRGWPIARLMWVVTLAQMALLGALLLGFLLIPHAAGDPDLFRDASGLPPAPYARFIGTLLAALGIQVLTVLVRLAAAIIAHRHLWSPARDPFTTAALVAGFVLWVGGLALWPVALPANFLYVSGWKALGLARRPIDAIERFRDLADRFPSSDLADAALFRVGRILQVHLGEVARAAGTYEELVARYPSSPLVDDALVEAARCLADTDPARARALADRMLAGFPRSYGRTEALLVKARALARLGDRPGASAILDALDRDLPVARLVRDPDDEGIEVVTLTAATRAVRQELGL